MKTLSALFLGITLGGCAESVKVTPLSLTPTTLVRYSDCGEYRDDYLRLHFRFDSPMRTSDGSFAAKVLVDVDKTKPEENAYPIAQMLYKSGGQYLSDFNGKTFQAGDEADVLMFADYIAETSYQYLPHGEPRTGIKLLNDQFDQIRVQIRLANIIGGADSNTMTFSRDEVITALTHQPKTEIRVPLSPLAECPKSSN
ncbi:hypothetical protein QCD60_14515 [Pokkaliibacter sp. MBI-7]|uniref:hypothetical protein n=1 Tax=Pokkaliibacter sp. MBI-7 TaxID=3040600 RepID=UPI002448F66A|nr:hypothetical protein [Pokkaliibacter sp. MBI-7]MDH2433783.1 hypothetical protein [Pokkaliibacter sp. MBI-7]